MKKMILALIIVWSAVNVNAQNKTANSLTYKTAIGVKFWNGGGVTLKTFVKDKSALEFIGFFYKDGTRLTGLYEFHGDLSTEGNLKWYIGFGGHVRLYKNYTFGGVDGVLGIDYKFKDLPINVSLDWQPTVETGGGAGTGFVGNWGGLAVRYTL